MFRLSEWFRWIPLFGFQPPNLVRTDSGSRSPSDPTAGAPLMRRVRAFALGPWHDQAAQLRPVRVPIPKVLDKKRTCPANFHNLGFLGLSSSHFGNITFSAAGSVFSRLFCQWTHSKCFGAIHQSSFFLAPAKVEVV